MRIRREAQRVALSVLALLAVCAASFGAELPQAAADSLAIDNAIHQGNSAAGAGHFADAMTHYREGVGKTGGRAEFLIGGLTAEGNGVPKDYTKAERWFRLSADQGFVGGMAALADLYGRGWGVKKDLNEAFRWRKAAADTGQPTGMLDLARSYELGMDGQTSRDEAIRWYRAAAQRGNPDAQAALRRLKEPPG